MARRKKAPVERTLKFTGDEFKKAVVEVTRQKRLASEYGGMAGQVTKAFVEKTGFSKQAFGFLQKLHKLDDQLKAQSIMDEVVAGFEMLGLNDQGNLFDRVGAYMERNVEASKPGVEEEDDPRPRFMKGAMGLGDAERAFEKAKADNPPAPAGKKPRKKKGADALDVLAGGDPAAMQ